MAAKDRARDFLARFITDTSRFETDDAARGLERTGEAATDTGRNLKDMQSDADDAGRRLREMGEDASRAARELADTQGEVKETGADLERLADDGRDTARRLDDTFDAIRRASRAGLKDVGDDADKAGKQLAEVGDEGVDTAREMGASFSGSADDITDAVQEVAANALQAFGAIGTAIGVAAAVGIGVFRQRMEQLKETTAELTTDMIDAGGRLERESVLARLREMAEDGSILKLRDQAKSAGVPVQDFMLAMAGDPEAVRRTQAVLERQITAIREHAAATGMASGAQASEVTNLTNLYAALEGNTGAYEAANDAAQLYLTTAEQTGQATALSAEQLAAYGDSLASFVDPLGAYTDKLAEKNAAEQTTAEATAAATKDQTDSWEDYAHAQAVSLDEYLANLAAQVEAQSAWAANMRALAGRVSEDTLAALAEMGPEGAQLVAELVNGTDAQLAQLESLYGRRTADGTAAIIAGLDAAADPAAAAAGRAGTGAGDRFATSIREREQSARRAAAAVADGVAAELERDFHPVITPRLNMLPLRQSLSQELTARTRP